MTWERYACHPQFVLGFHGCDESVGESILNNHSKHLRPSLNDYDWLGCGIYFWEDSPERAFEFARERASGGKNSKGEIITPFVLGAVINLGRCLNLMDRSALKELRGAYDGLNELFIRVGKGNPANGSWFRSCKLDCAVFEFLHNYREKNKIHQPYETTRGLFFEGNDLYPGAGIKEKDHIQICVRNVNCILGYFRPIRST